MSEKSDQSRRMFLKNSALIASGAAATGLAGSATAGSGEDFVIRPGEINVCDVSGTDKHFPVRRVYCLGRNYSAHAVEMGGQPGHEAAFLLHEAN